MNIQVVRRADSLALVVAGDVDLATVSRLEEALAQAQSTGAETLIVDLDQVSFIDSTGLHVLLKYVALSSESGRQVQLTRGSAPVQRLFEVSGVLDLLPFVAD